MPGPRFQRWPETQDLTRARPTPLVLVPKSLQGLTGTPLVAGSPIRHESAVQGSAVEVQTYQPPWKALSEFALQSDLDQPAFQQLVRPGPGRETSGRGRASAIKPRWWLGSRGLLEGWAAGTAAGEPVVGGGGLQPHLGPRHALSQASPAERSLGRPRDSVASRRARPPTRSPCPGASSPLAPVPPGVLLRVWLPRQLLRQRCDFPVLAAPRHAQQHGAESGGDVRGTPSPRTAHAPCMRFARAEAPSAESSRLCNCYYCYLKRTERRRHSHERQDAPAFARQDGTAPRTWIFSEPEFRIY